LSGKERIKVFAGQMLRVEPPVKMCQHGLHASKKAIDALSYAPGATVCRVELSGEVLEDTAKVCAAERTVVWMADATRVLHEFACWCAEEALKRAKVTDERCWNAIKKKRAWLDGNATDEELAAAQAAAGAATRTAARAAAWAATATATRAAARAVAWAARAAAREEYSAELERRLMALAPPTSEQEEV